MRAAAHESGIGDTPKTGGWLEAWRREIGLFRSIANSGVPHGAVRKEIRMRLDCLACAMLIIGVAVGPANAQRLDPPGSVIEGGKLNAISSQSVASRFRKDRYRRKAKVECAQSDAYQAEQAKRRANRS